MNFLANILVTFVALIHVWIVVLEMFLWTRPLGRKTFRLSPEQAEQTKVLAMNQGLYNGFLAAGLFWGLLIGQTHIQLFFLSCVLVAGIFGAMTVGKKILFVQAMPALLAMLAVFFSH